MRIRGARYTSFVTALFSHPKTVLFVGVVLVALVALPLVKKINQKRALDSEIQALQAQAQKVEQKNTGLRDMIDYLETTSFVETQARLNLDLKKPGEKVVVVKNTAGERRADEAVSSVFNIPGLEKIIEPPRASNAQRWWEHFFGMRATSRP